MKNPCYINGIGAVNAQGTWSDDPFTHIAEISNPLTMAIQPSYKELIPPAMIRRMSKGIKMGIFASQQALDDAAMGQVDAIITGTGLGCLEDSEKFLRNVLDNDEQFLTPTSFIQSTHNTVGAQIALRLGCKSYNFTYVNGATSFESALLDALIQMESEEANHVLVGGIDEIAGQTFVLKQLVQEVKANGTEEKLRDSQSPGVNFGEGGTFFALSTAKKDNTYAQILDVSIQNKSATEELTDFVTSFLTRNQISLADISAVVIGNNGDLVYDKYYTSFCTLFADKPQIFYKHLVGQSDVAAAFGLATAAFVLKNQIIPEAIQWNAVKHSALNYVLLYNQYLGKDHSLTLLHHVET
ncbi:3-oxoacyl-ACP synthase [Sphingobacterium olei]|uniref:3-oxoacyl-ACP synthase n=1 Tax=Sphingobacterium olei TaxID=2571155 RepID=A0A4U0P420_9SPHI|nr:beta-ketoacyl synthase chain length factor [Sphingobacterium olei]TJZ61930.1 3-oxoacyl-ACP synthase [Sphingobacterium olei]